MKIETPKEVGDHIGLYQYDITLMKTEHGCTVTLRSPKGTMLTFDPAKSSMECAVIKSKQMEALAVNGNVKL